MKTAGIIGGIGPESTIEYYRLLIVEYRARVPGGGFPPVLINSIDLSRLLGLMGAGELEAVTDWVGGEVRRLAAAGADFAALAASTPHMVFDEIRRRSPIPMVSLVEAAREAAHAMHLRRVGLFGTRFTMQAPFYPAVFAARGIEVVAPPEADRTWIHETYVGELLNGVILPTTRRALLEIARRMREEQGVEGIVLGGTELSLILRDVEGPGIPLLDTTRIHVGRILDEMLS